MLNHLTIMGRLVADPELRTTQNGIPVTSFRIAVERNYAGQDGEQSGSLRYLLIFGPAVRHGRLVDCSHRAQTQGKGCSYVIQRRSAAIKK